MRSLTLHQIQARRRILSRFCPDLTTLLLLLLLLWLLLLLLLRGRWGEDAGCRVFAALFVLLLGGAAVALEVFARGVASGFRGKILTPMRESVCGEEEEEEGEKEKAEEEEGEEEEEEEKEEEEQKQEVKEEVENEK